MRNWPAWIGYVVAAVSAMYAMLGVYWTFGGAGFPVGVGDPEMVDEGAEAIVGNLLGFAVPEVAGPAIAALGGLGAVAATLMARGWGNGAASRALLGFSGALAVGLTVVVQDYRSIIVVAYTPILVVGKTFFGWPAESGFGDLYMWPRLNLLIWLLIGVAWALTALAYRRRTTGACANCGSPAASASSSALTWGRRAVLVAVVTPLIYCASRWAWALGFSLGIDAEFYRQGQENGLWILGAMLATLGALGAVLTLGLVQRWGEVFPRWMIGLRGRRVPPMLAVIPASLVAVLVIAAGFMYVRVAIGHGLTAETLAMVGPELLWPIWGAALFVAAMAYHRRRRTSC
ncbi:MAG: hypothetical protein ACRDXX_00235, partial [Stackebrandtia sp.]